MTLTHDIYEDLNESLEHGSHHMLSKIYTTPTGISLIYAINRDTKKRYFYFRTDWNAADAIPQCKGLSIENVHLYEYSQVDYFCQIAQTAGDESYIYEIIIEDIRKNVDELTNEQKVATRISKILLKWKTFFSQEKSLILSPERQQGLYGELLFLNQLIDMFGTMVVTYWGGCDYETHDFYIKGNAIEIKTTSAKAPYKMHINSEYQLDNEDVEGTLLIEFLILRKSISDGEKLPELILKIRDKLADDLMMEKMFNKKLENYGYFDGMEDKYTTGYFIREKHIYHVSEGFPRITKKSICEGVSCCVYDVLASTCTLFEISEKEKWEKLKGGKIIDRQTC